MKIFKEFELFKRCYIIGICMNYTHISQMTVL